MDRSSTSSSASAGVRGRLDALRMESQDLEVQTRQLTDALETLVRIQARQDRDRTRKERAFSHIRGIRTSQIIREEAMGLKKKFTFSHIKALQGCSKLK